MIGSTFCPGEPCAFGIVLDRLPFFKVIFPSLSRSSGLMGRMGGVGKFEHARRS